jgi:type IV secretory system conjugative DNA transfer VirD4/TraG family protein
MWHDTWPPLSPSGHRPPDVPPFTSPGDQLLALGLGATVGAGALVWATGQLAGLAFGHTWLDLSPADVAHVLWHLPHHWSDPAQAWPAQVRGPLPGPAGMYATLASLVGGLSGGTAAVLRHLPGRAAGHRPGHARPAKHAGAVWASNRELRLLTVREPERGRVILGRTPGLLGRLLAAEDCHSVLVFGPTGSYKTSALVIPGVLEWSGPLLATSVKPDLLRATMAHRARLGQVLVIDPLGASGVTAAKWSPLASCGTWAGAQQMAVQLANAIEQTPTEEQRPEHRFWKTMGTKFLAPILFAAAVKGLSMADVIHWLDSREDQQVKDLLDAAGVPVALDAWESSQYRTDRAVDSLYATAEEVLHVYANQRVAASTEGHDLDLDQFLQGDNTIYLYAPAHQQRLLRPLFEAITQQVVAAAQEQAALAPDGMLNPRLGRGRQLRRPVGPGRAGHHRPGAGHPAGHCVARQEPAGGPLRRQGVHDPEQPSRQAVPLRPGRPVGARTRRQADRRAGADRAQPVDGLRRTALAQRVDAVSAVAAGGGPAAAAAGRGGAAVRAPAADADPAATLLPAPGAAPAGACRGARFSAAGAGAASAWPQDRTRLCPAAAPQGA